MTNVISFSIVRQGDAKKAIPARDKAVVMEPVAAASSTSAKMAESGSLSLTPLDRIFTKPWMDFFGEYAVLPPPKAKSKVSTSPDAETTFAKLHKDLHQAWVKRDADKLERVASAHLNPHFPDGDGKIWQFGRYSVVISA